MTTRPGPHTRWIAALLSGLVVGMPVSSAHAHGTTHAPAVMYLGSGETLEEPQANPCTSATAEVDLCIDLVNAWGLPDESARALSACREGGFSALRQVLERVQGELSDTLARLEGTANDTANDDAWEDDAPDDDASEDDASEEGASRRRPSSKKPKASGGASSPDDEVNKIARIEHVREHQQATEYALSRLLAEEELQRATQALEAGELETAWRHHGAATQALPQQGPWDRCRMENLQGFETRLVCVQDGGTNCDVDATSLPATTTPKRKPTTPPASQAPARRRAQASSDWNGWLISGTIAGAAAVGFLVPVGLHGSAAHDARDRYHNDPAARWTAKEDFADHHRMAGIWGGAVAGAAAVAVGLFVASLYLSGAKKPARRASTRASLRHTWSPARGGATWQIAF